MKMQMSKKPKSEIKYNKMFQSLDKNFGQLLIEVTTV